MMSLQGQAGCRFLPPIGTSWALVNTWPYIRPAYTADACENNEKRGRLVCLMRCATTRGHLPDGDTVILHDFHRIKGHDTSQFPNYE